MSDEPHILDASIRTAQLHSDNMGEWVVIDDGPDYAQVVAVPAAWESRRILSRGEAVERFEALSSVPLELDAMRRAFDALDSLDTDSRVRALRWLVDRLW